MKVTNVFPPKIDPIFDAGPPDEAGNYKHERERTVYMTPMEYFSDAEDREEERRNPVVGFASTVDHPPHYTQGPCEAHEARSWIHDRVAPHDPALARALYEALKYGWRCGLKGDPKEDCAKARWYLEQLPDLDS